MERNTSLPTGGEKPVLIFIVIAGLTLVYSGKIIDVVNEFIFKDENIAAFKLTFTGLMFIPLSLYLALITFAVITNIYHKIRYGKINKPAASLVIKHICLFVAVLAATALAMQCNTVVYTDGSIKSYNYIEKYSPEYTVEDYKNVKFWGECIGSRRRSPSFRFYFTFILNDDTYVDFYPEEFRDNDAIKALGDELGDKFSVLPEEGFSSEYILYMSEDEIRLWNLMYNRSVDSSEDDEPESEQSHYAFDGYYDFN